MITLKHVTIHQFKCVESDQAFEVEPDVTLLVGMNESGKTSILQALGKTKYFDEDPAFRFNPTHDFPRKDKKRMDKSRANPKAVTCTFGIANKLVDEITADLGQGVFTPADITQCVHYDNTVKWDPPVVDFPTFVIEKTKALGISSKTLNEKLTQVQGLGELKTIIAEYQEENLVEQLTSLERYFANEWGWDHCHPLCEYVARIHLSPHMPKFLYYDEYYALPSRIRNRAKIS